MNEETEQEEVLTIEQTLRNELAWRTLERDRLQGICNLRKTDQENIQDLENRLAQLNAAYQNACKEIMELHKAISQACVISEKLNEILNQNDHIRPDHRPTPVPAANSTVPLDD